MSARFRRSLSNAVAHSLRGAGLAASNRGALELAASLEVARRERERVNRTLKLHADLEAKRRKADERWHAGTAPYGWRSIGHGRLEAVPREQVVVEWLHRQRATGFGWEELARLLNEAGTPAPMGGRWHMSTVRRIVNRGRGWVPPAAVLEAAEGQSPPATSQSSSMDSGPGVGSGAGAL